jgi:flagellar assembly protein FliH
MTSTWHKTLVVPALDHERVRPARLDHPLRGSSLLTDLHADARIVDPRLAQIVDDAAQHATARGHGEGYAAGYEDGLAAARADAGRVADAQRTEHENALDYAIDRLGLLASALQAAASSLEERMAPTYDEIAPEIGGLVYELVEVLLGRELETDRVPVLAAVRRAAVEAPRNAPLVVHLHPRDFATVTDMRVDLESIAGRPVTVVVDTTMEPGGAIADSGSRRVDARLSVALEHLRAELTA